MIEDNTNIISIWESQQILPFYLEEMKRGKNKAVKNQNFEAAADYRFQEKRILNLLQEYETHNNRRRR